MRCEICGRDVPEEGTMVEVEGARLLVCEQCRRFGAEVRKRPTDSHVTRSVQPTVHTARETGKQPPKPKPSTGKPYRPFRQRTEQPVRKESVRPTEYELVDDYPKQIRQGREALKLTQVDLAKRLGEKLSIIQKLETGKMRPSDALAEKINRALRINLTTPITDEAESGHFEKSSLEITIGDVAKSVTKKKPDEAV